MDAIKKKMQAMKLEKDNAMDRADACEQQAKDANLRAERVGSCSNFNFFSTALHSCPQEARIAPFWWQSRLRA